MGSTRPTDASAIVFSALIHDTDHRGVSNVQLSKEDESMAALSQEQECRRAKLLDIAWAVLMSEDFEELRATLFATRAISSIPQQLSTSSWPLTSLTRSSMIFARGVGTGLLVTTTKSITISGLIVNGTSCRLQTCRTRCSIGTFTESGTINYL
jgi:hypothetical protein